MDTYLTAELLVSILRHRFIDREIGHPDDIGGELYVMVRRAGYSTVEGFEALLDRTENGVLTEERIRPPASGRRRYNAIEVVECALRIDDGGSSTTRRYSTLDRPEDATRAMQEYLERFPDGSVRTLDDATSHVLSGAVGWVVTLDDTYCVLRVVRTQPTVLLLRAGIAIDIPRGHELAEHVAGLNRTLMAGRAFMTVSAAHGRALVVLEESLWARAVSVDFEPSIQDCIDRFGYVIGIAPKARTTIIERFGGIAYADSHVMTLVD